MGLSSEGRAADWNRELLDAYKRPCCVVQAAESRLVALCAMVLGHDLLALPVNLGLGLVVTLLCPLLELTPSSATISAFAKGQWLLSQAPWEALVPTVPLALGLLSLRWLLGLWYRPRV